MRITAYADRLLDDLEALDWPEAMKLQQRNWIGRSEGARVDFPIDGEAITVFTTRPDTLFGATYMVLAPEHPLVDKFVPEAWPEGSHGVEQAVAPRPPRPSPPTGCRPPRSPTSNGRPRPRTDRCDSPAPTRPTPVNGEQVPVFIADYVLMGYGTGAIMAVPAGDQRDLEFARAFELPIRCIVEPVDGRGTDASTWENAFGSYDAKIVDSSNDDISLDGLAVAEAKERVAEWLARKGVGEGTVNFRLRDWLFSRQRYWGEPFPIVYDDGVAHALPESMLPLELPEVEDYSPRTFDPDDPEHLSETPLSRNEDWVNVTLDLGDGRRRSTAARPTPCPTGPVPAGTSCATWTRTTTRSWSTRPSSSTGWVRARASRTVASTCTSAAPSTPCCTCCTRVSGRRCCTTWGICPRSSRSTSCSTRA